MPLNFLVQLAIAVVLAVLSYVLTPKPKRVKPEAAKDLEDPTAEAGRPIPVVFGTVTVTGPNILWYGEKSTKTYEVDA
ncbi:hypothetical protein [uncultured Sulfitobacter sp.]|uniref:hypothetical protein n=1 Tax=uncultured Sulfitobacter sp. TaxID=191468 RepID=UPI0025995A98|nr:hypothetical protein [uncultured Sulfitobacter sp.]